MSERELSTIDKLVETEEKTNGDGSISVTLDGWEEAENDNISVYFITPTGDRMSEQMTFPQPGGDLSEYKFYRLVKQAGLTMRNADLLEGEEVRARRASGNGNSSDSWWLEVPESTTTTDKTIDRATQVAEFVKDVNWRRNIITVFWMVAVLSLIGIGVALL